jgi:hypothetical protein
MESIKQFAPPFGKGVKGGFEGSARDRRQGGWRVGKLHSSFRNYHFEPSPDLRITTYKT